MGPAGAGGACFGAFFWGGWGGGGGVLLDILLIVRVVLDSTAFRKLKEVNEE
jgi:hypothetical protein